MKLPNILGQTNRSFASVFLAFSLFGFLFPHQTKQVKQNHPVNLITTEHATQQEPACRKRLIFRSGEGRGQETELIKAGSLAAKFLRRQPQPCMDSPFTCKLLRSTDNVLKVRNIHSHNRAHFARNGLPLIDTHDTAERRGLP
jgi:hypothetical protein